MIGARIIAAAWGSVALFALVAIPDLFDVEAFDDAAVGVSATLFLVSLPIWIYAFVLAVARTSRGDDIAVSSLFFLAGSAPPPVRKHLMYAFAASVLLAAITCWANPAAVLVPMLPLGLAGLWGARYGTFPARTDARPSR